MMDMLHKCNVQGCFTLPSSQTQRVTARERPSLAVPASDHAHEVPAAPDDVMSSQPCRF